MSYQIPYQSSATSQSNIIVQDGTINTTATSLALVGANSVNFGLYINQNFVELLQSFASNTSPTSPLIGQLWYNTNTGSINYYNGKTWSVLTPPFDGVSGTATVSILGNGVALTLAGNEIIYAVSLVAFPQASLPLTVLINDTSYAMASRFSQGLGAGITMATDANGLQLWGNARTANAFSSNMTITVTGSANASVTFNGSSNVTMPIALTNVVPPGYYTNVYVGSNGIVTSGGYISNLDVTTALGYTPGVQNGPANVLTFGSNIIINGVVGGSNIFHGNSNIIITTTFLDNPMPTNGIILLPISSTLPVGWAVANGQVITLPNGGGSVVTANINGSAPTGTNYIQKVY
jgi:hypothetical protein